MIPVHGNKLLTHSNKFLDPTTVVSDSIYTGLISQYKLNGNSNDNISGYNGVDTNVAYGAGKIGDAAFISYVADNQKITIPDSQSYYNFIWETGVFTINFWFNCGFSNAVIMSNYVGPAGNKGFSVSTFGDEGSAINFGFTNGTVTSNGGVSIITDGAWRMFTIIGNGSIMKVYTNGVQYGFTFPINGLASGNASSNLIIGNDPGYDAVSCPPLDNIQIWSTDKTAYLSDLYNGGAGLEL